MNENGQARGVFWLALAVSLLLHAAALTRPGWQLPMVDADLPIRLTTTLVPPVVAPPSPSAASPRPARVPPVQKKAPPSVPLPAVPATDHSLALADSQTAGVPEPALPPAPPPVLPELPSSVASAEPAESAEPAAESAAPAPSGVSLERLPPSGRVIYDVRRGDGFVAGRGEQRWHHDGTHYTLHAAMETTGLAAFFHGARVVQESRGVFDATGLRPLTFDTWRDGKSKDSVRFDPEQGQITQGKGGRTPYVANAQDVLSLIYQLSLLPSDRSPVELTIANGRKLRAYTVEIGARGLLELPLGSSMTRAYTIRAAGGEETTEVWLEMETRLPVKIRHLNRKGEVFEQVATRIELDPLP